MYFMLLDLISKFISLNFIHLRNFILAKFKTFGCGSAIASSSYGTEYIKGKCLNSAMDFSNKEIAKYLNLPPVKLHCSMLAEGAIKAAVHDYKNKNNGNKL